MLTHFCITQQGQRHIEKGVPCQDYSASMRIKIEQFGCEIVIAAVSDGVGSCEFSQYGSEIAVSCFMKYVEVGLNKLYKLSDKDVINLIRDAFSYSLMEVEKDAENRELPFLEFDSTLTGIVYDGTHLWFGHIGDDGIVALFSDGNYKMITTRHKGDEAHSVIPLRENTMWEFGKAEKDVVSCALMTDGVLDYCVDVEVMNNRVFFPFLEPALTDCAENDDSAEEQRLDWDEYLSGHGNYPKSFRQDVTDDISLVVIQNPDMIKKLPIITFDYEKWDEDTAKRKKELDEALYADFRSYKAGRYFGSSKPANGFFSNSRNTDSKSKTNPQSTQTDSERDKSSSMNTDNSSSMQSGTSFDNGFEDDFDAPYSNDDRFEEFIIDASHALNDVADSFIGLAKSAESLGRAIREPFMPHNRSKQRIPSTNGNRLADDTAISETSCDKPDFTTDSKNQHSEGGD